MNVTENYIKEMAANTGMSVPETAADMDRENMLAALYAIIEEPINGLIIAKNAIQEHLTLLSYYHPKYCKIGIKVDLRWENAKDLEER